jgi:hypothetical protein
VSVYRLYPDEDAFWKDFSKPDPSSGEIRPMNWGGIVVKARKIRREINTKDVQQARSEYAGKTPGFDEVFSYRKGSKICVTKTAADIARKYRGMNKRYQPWDKM